MLKRTFAVSAGLLLASMWLVAISKYCQYEEAARRGRRPERVYLTEWLGVIFDLRRVSLEFRKFKDVFHPTEPFSRLYLHCRR